MAMNTSYFVFRTFTDIISILDKLAALLNISAAILMLRFQSFLS